MGRAKDIKGMEGELFKKVVGDSCTGWGWERLRRSPCSKHGGDDKEH